MINNKKILAIIPARGGSKGVPRKNIRLIAGKPLIAWTIDEAKKSKYIDRIILSSEDKEIIAIAGQWGCEVPFVRPLELAQDNVTGIEPVLHALKNISGRYDYFILLQPTSPLRTVEDIDGCIEKCLHSNAPACVTVTEPDKSPFWMFYLDDRALLHPVVRQKNRKLLRQELDSIYALNGAVYVAKVSWFKKNKKFISRNTIAYIMPKERSIDIDTELDLRICHALLSEKNCRSHD